MRSIVNEVKGAAYALLMLKEAALDALLGPHCTQCRVPTRVFPRDQYAHNLTRHRR
jgi:hypothetical protein